MKGGEVLRYKTCKYILTFAALVIMTFSTTVQAIAGTIPFQSYTYDAWLNSVPVPHSFLPYKIIRGIDLGIGHFSNPSAIFYHRQAREVYLLDSGNNRIVIMDYQMRLVDVIENLNNNGAPDSLNLPQGVFVNDTGIFVADTHNNRILVIDREGNVLNEFGRPDTELISPHIVWLPRQLVVDNAGRIYVIATGVNMGLVELDNQGNFRNFKGANRVRVNMFQYIVRRYFSTAEQRARMPLFVPTEYSGMAIDEYNFIYVTTNRGLFFDLNIDQELDVRRLNARGDCILRRLGNKPVVGADLYTPTGLVDIAVDRNGVFSVLGRANGRIMTYDHDGNLLDVFGGLGFRKGLFQAPVALDYVEDNIVVVDSFTNSITVFRPTAYGLAMRQATYLFYLGDYVRSAEYWQIVLDHNANSDLAYIGLGRIHMRNRDYVRAMEYFRFANARDHYSNAFSRHRRIFIQENFPTAATVLIVVWISLKIVFKIRKLVLGKYQEEEAYDVVE